MSYDHKQPTKSFMLYNRLSFTYLSVEGFQETQMQADMPY